MKISKANTARQRAGRQRTSSTVAVVAEPLVVTLSILPAPTDVQ